MDSNSDHRHYKDSWLADPVNELLQGIRTFSITSMDNLSQDDKLFALDVIPIFEWLTLWFSKPYTERHYQRSSVSFDQFFKEERAQLVLQICQDIRQQIPGICPASLWNLVVSQDEKYEVPLGIFSYILENQQHPFSDPVRHHTDCTEQLCSHAFDDTSRIEQLHKCRKRPNRRNAINRTCGTIEVPVEKLAELFDSSGTWICTAWDVSSWNPASANENRNIIENFIKIPAHLVAKEVFSGSNNPRERYMAISHVWSDGTGVGVGRQQGHVNTCLMHFWVKIAQRENCDGLWWDTICIPTEQKARGAALRVMLKNFSNAAVFLIHDEELANTTWTTESQKRAIALVLSSWFSRGWTAAEFAAAGKCVKIVFKNTQDPADNEPLLVDLGSILAHEYISSQDKANRGLTLPTLAHLSASVLLKKIYGKILDFESHHTTFRSLMSLMRSRSTAWEKDRLKIAMLLSRHDGGSDFDPSHTVPELTRRLLTRLGSIPITAAFHGESPMSQHGP